MYLSKDGMSFLWMLHNAPISRTSPKTQANQVVQYVHCEQKHNIKMDMYSRAKMSCCLVSEDPLVGKKFSSSSDTCRLRETEMAYYRALMGLRVGTISKGEEQQTLRISKQT